MSAARAREIRDEQIRIYYGNIPALLVNLLVGALLAFALWDVAPPFMLKAWCAALALVTILRALCFWGYQRNPAARSERRWTIYAALGAGASGIVWGIGGALLYPPASFEYQLLVLFVLVWLGAGAVTSLSVYLPAFFLYLPMSMLPITGALLAQGGRIHIALATIAVIYVAALLVYGRGLNRSLVETLRLRFENVDLVIQLAHKSEEAERANVDKSKFLAAASHDLRQPLHTLSLFTSMLDDEVRTPRGRRLVASVNESVRALEKMFAVLLDVSRLDAGVLQPTPQSFRLCDLLAPIVNDFTPEADAKGLTFDCRVEPATVVHSDPALLERILRNYISNAVRYTEHGRITVESVPTSDAVRIEVADTGIGIPATQHQEIFREFHQLGNPERDRSKGLGLGLAIVDRVARLLEHPIGVASEPGIGSRFWVTVPCGEILETAAEADRPAGAAPGDISDLRVAVIDDEADTRTAMRELLEHWGCVVMVAASEEEAVAAAKRDNFAPDAIVADYRLRDGRTGAQAIERLHAEFARDVPALIVTGDTAPERLREARASGHQLVHKPVAPSTLRAFLGNARRLAESRRQATS